MLFERFILCLLTIIVSLCIIDTGV